MKKIFSKKLFAVILSLTLIASVSFIPSMITASAEEADATTSLLYGINADYSYYGQWGVWNSGTYQGMASPQNMTALTNGITAVGTHMDLYEAAGKTLTWMLKERSEITSIAVWNYDYTPMQSSYKVYVSDTLDTLYTDASLVYTHMADGVTNQAYQNPKSGDADFTVRSGWFVGVSIVATGSDASSRIREIAAFGTPDSEGYESLNAVNTTLLNVDVAAADGDSIIADKTPFEVYWLNGTTKNNINGASDWKVALTDGTATATNVWATLGKAAYYTYQLDDFSNITGYAFYQGNLGLLQNVEFYAGTDPATLYDESNKMDTFVSAPQSSINTRYGHETTFGSANVKAATFVGFKVTTVSTTDGGNRMSELQVFGEGGATGTIKRTALPADANNTSLIYGKSFTNAWCDEYLLQTDPENAYKYTGAFNAYQANLGRLTDGVIANTSHADLFAYHTKMVWQLDSTTEIKSFLLYNREYVQSTEYRVYAAENLDDLFADSSMIYSYTYKNTELGDTIDPDKLAEKGQYVNFYGDDIKTANFVGLWLLDTEMNTVISAPAGSNYSRNKDCRINEIAFFGTPTGENIGYTYHDKYTTGRGSYGTTTAINPDFTFANNILNADNLTVKNASGSVVSLSYKGKYTDGDFASEVGGNDKNWTYTYSMPNETRFSGFAFFSGNEFRKQSYSVYVGYSADSLYDDTNCVFSWDWRKNPKGNVETVEFNDGYATGMFIGIKITDLYDDGSSRVCEWAAWGTNDPSYSINPNLALTSDVSTASTHTNLLKGIQAKTGMMGKKDSYVKMTDGIANSGDYADVYGNGSVIDWKYGELLFELDYPADVNSFAMWQTNSNRKYGYEVYMSDNKGTLGIEENRVMTWHAGYSSTSWGQMITFAEAKSVQYVLIKILDTNFENDSIRIGEIALFGEYKTAADGYIADSNFVGIDSNDIDAVSSPDKIYYTSTFTFPAANLGYTLDSFGTLVYPTTALGGNELTIDNTDAAAAVPGADLLNTVKGYVADGYKAVRTTAVFSGANNVGATTKLTSRSYVIYKDADNNQIVFYSDPVSYSLTQMKRIKAKNLIENYGQSNLAAEEIVPVADKSLWNAEINDVWDFAIMAGTGVNNIKNSAVNAGSAWLSDKMTTYGVTDEMLNNGIYTYGDSSRMAKAIRKLMNGGDITLVQLGGSVTEGYNAESAETSQGAQVYNFLNAMFPGHVTFVNAGIAATGAEFGRFRMQEDVLNYNPDIVIVEYAVNDLGTVSSANAAYESVIRALLDDGRDIAVVALYNCLKTGNVGTSTNKVVADYYDLPQIEVYSAYGSAPFFKNDGSDVNNFFGNGEGTHPSTAGHARVGMLTANYILQILNNIEEQSTVINGVTGASLRTGGDFNNGAIIIKSSDINAGNANVVVTGGTYNATTQSVGSSVILGKNAGTLNTVRENNTYSYYEIASGSEMTFTIHNATDAFLLFKMSNNCGNANITVSDSRGNVETWTETAKYAGSLTTESARIYNSSRLFRNDCTDVTVTVEAEDGVVRIAGVLFAGQN